MDERHGWKGLVPGGQGGDTPLGCLSGEDLFQPIIKALRPGIWCTGFGVAVGHERLHVVISHPAADDQHSFVT